MVLAAKRLDYKEIEITPGLGQVAIFRLSGQRQVPVLVDGDQVISDSSVIIQYIEKLYPDPILIPDDPKEKALVHLIENWADTSMAKSARIALIKSAARDPHLRDALLTNGVTEQFRILISSLPSQFLGSLSSFINQSNGADLLSNLEKLSNSVSINQFLIGNSMSLADIAIAAQLSLLKFPKSSGPQLAGLGCPGFSDNNRLAALFDWRDQLEDRLMELNSSQD